MESVEALRLHVDVDAMDEDGMYGLAYACTNGHADVVKWLLKNGASMYVGSSFREWAISDEAKEVERRAKNGDQQAHQLLVAAAPNEGRGDGKPTLVEMTGKSGHYDIVALLMKHGYEYVSTMDAFYHGLSK